MELIELDATAQRALELLTNAGMSDGSIYDYTHTGFGSILRHFHTKGILYATAEMLDIGRFCLPMLASPRRSILGCAPES